MQEGPGMKVQLVFDNGSTPITLDLAATPAVGDQVYVLSTPYRVFAVHWGCVHVTYDGKGH
jgi:hypothetical protein